MSLSTYFKAAPDAIQPITVNEYRIFVAQYLVTRVATIAAIFFIYKWAAEQGLRDIQYGVFAATLIVEFILYKYFYKKIDYRKRLRDLYPTEIMPSRIHMALVFLSSLTFFLVTLDMLFSTAEPNKRLPWFYRRSMWPIVLMLVGQYVFFGLTTKKPVFGNFTTPTFSYMAGLIGTYKKSAKANQDMKAQIADGYRPKFDKYYLDGELNTTKMILGLVAWSRIAAYQSKLPDQEKLSYKKDTYFDLFTFLKQYKPHVNPLKTIPPLSLLAPVGLFEGLLLKLVDMSISDVATEKVISGIENLIDQDKNPTINQLKSDFADLPIYKTVQRNKNSKLFLYMKKLNE